MAGVCWRRVWPRPLRRGRHDVRAVPSFRWRPSIGLAVDFGRVYSVKSHTQSALDAAALAAGRVAQVETTDTVTKASAAATAYFNQAKPDGCRHQHAAVLAQRAEHAVHGHGDLVGEDAVPRASSHALVHKARRRGARRLPGQLLRLRDADDAPPPPRSARARLHRHRRRRQQRRDLPDARRHRLHVQPCTKIEPLKSAAKDLIDIVVWDDQSQYTRGWRWRRSRRPSTSAPRWRRWCAGP